jgi:hypothetical protein
VLKGLAELVILFGVVFALNVISAFAPPPWKALSWVGFSHPHAPFVVALIAAVAATAGRLVLANFSRVIIRNRFMGEAVSDQVNSSSRDQRHQSSRKRPKHRGIKSLNDAGLLWPS